MAPLPNIAFEGILPINKDEKKNSFSLISSLRKVTGIKKIGHAGTLDPLASGVMILLIGRRFTKKSQFFLNQDKEYLAKIQLGTTTTSWDLEGKILTQDPYIPSLVEIEKALSLFQGEVQQIPPMFSAKKVNGKKLYELARKGIEIPRNPITVRLKTTLLSYSYPFLDLHVQCTKGTYIRSLAYEIGTKLQCGAFLFSLKRTRVGPYKTEDCVWQRELFEPNFQLSRWIQDDANL
jgi:tRNA pseudouridine55 synthase